MWLSRGLIATSFPVGEAITRGLDPVTLTLVRFALASLLFAPFIALRYGIRLPPWRALAGYAVISLCLVTFFWGMFAALRTTTALNTSAIFTLVPGLAAIYAWTLLRERLGIYRLGALAIGLVGALWIVFRGDLDLALSLAFNRGDLLFAAACLVMALYMPLIKKFHRGEPIAVMTFWILVTGTLWLVLFNNTKILTTDWAAVDINVFVGIAYLALVTTIFSFFLQQNAIVVLGPTRVAGSNYLNPALVIVIEWIAGHGIPALIVLPGVAIVVAAMAVLQRGAKVEETPEAFDRDTPAAGPA
jgi:drug/metabolite transporter (DMT)-like permease